MKPRIRLIDVARASGVSVSTASTALHGSGRGVAVSTLERVRQVARDLGYVPDPIGRALVKQAPASSGIFRGTVALLVHDRTDKGRQYLDWHTSRLAGRQNLRHLLAEEGYQLEAFILPAEQKALTALARVLRARGICGLLVELNNTLFELEFPWDDYPVAALSRHPLEREFPSVISHTAQDAILCWKQCHDRGYQKIGLVIEPRWFASWQHGFEVAVEAYGGGFKNNILRVEEWDESIFMKWLDRVQPDVVMANEGFHLVRALAARGISVPQDLGYCCLHVREGFETLTGIYQRETESSRRVVELLHQQIQAGETWRTSSQLNIDVMGLWHEGETLRPLKK
ncbi:MAG: LacI family DNA-binding transcriptional regulator [Candidatus Methylacidiphilales bacterium]|nr:LacI family DNA-binding transcriptional regulator [Candidatus Methylacidiphilales bacterium]